MYYTLQLLSKPVYTCLSVRLAVKHFYDNTKVAVPSQPDRYYFGVKWWIQNMVVLSVFKFVHSFATSYIFLPESIYVCLSVLQYFTRMV